LKECAQPYGEITTLTSADLEQIRSLIDKLQENNQVRILMKKRTQKQLKFGRQFTVKFLCSYDNSKQNLYQKYFIRVIVTFFHYIVPGRNSWNDTSPAGSSNNNGSSGNVVGPSEVELVLPRFGDGAQILQNRSSTGK